MNPNKKDNIIRIDFEEGNYARISNKILFDINLSSDAKIFLQIILNNKDKWELNTTYFAKKLGWHRDKLSRITKELIKHGYMIKEKIPIGGKGSVYNYTISEYGDLNKKDEGLSSIEIAKVATEVYKKEDKKVKPDLNEDKRIPTLEAMRYNLSVGTYKSLMDKVKTDKITLDELEIELNFYLA